MRLGLLRCRSRELDRRGSAGRRAGPCVKLGRIGVIRTSGVGVALLLLAACGTSAPAATTPAPVTTTATSPTPTESQSTSPHRVRRLPRRLRLLLKWQCLDRVPTASKDKGRIAVAVASAHVPSTVSLILGTQVIGSIEKQGMSEVVVRLCSAPLTDDELVDVAVIIARTIYAAPGHDTVSLLKVSSWVPDGSDSVKQDHSATTDDYQLTLWDAADDLVKVGWDLT